MEKGFFHPDRGYWQTLNEPSVEILESYPNGTVEVEIKPGPNFEWDGSTWVAINPPKPSRDSQEAARKRAYEAEADPLFFMAQRGEATDAEWLAKVAEIKTRFPYPQS